MKKIITILCLFLCLGLTKMMSATPRAQGAQEIQEDTVYPVVILGGGVGALTSAIYLQRAGVDSIVIEGQTPGGAIAQSPNVLNWPGEIEINGHALIEKIRSQAEFNGAKILSYEVTHVDFTKSPLAITIRSIQNPRETHKILAKSCIIALGANPKFLGIPGESGEQGYWTRGVYTCAVCDGALFKNKSVAVIGSGDTAILEADYLSKLAKKVYVIIRHKYFHTVEIKRKEELLKKPNVKLIQESNVIEIQGDGKKVTHIVLAHNNNPLRKQIPIDGVFIAIGSKPNTELFTGQLQLDNKGYIVLTNDQKTSVEGVYGIGDVVDPYYKQAISAAGDGAKAALQVERYLALQPETQQIINAKPKVVVVNNDSSVISVNTSDQFNQEIRNSSIPIIVDFYSPFCGPCQRLSPEFDKLSLEYAGRLKFVKVNISTATELAENYNIYAIPTMIVFDAHGKVIEQATGSGDINKLFKKLDKIANTN